MRVLRSSGAARCLFAVCAALAGCHPHQSHGSSGGSSGGPAVLTEVEPNDSAFEPDFLGGVDAFSHFVVRGRIDAFGPDLFDGFAMVADEPLDVFFRLDPWNPHADLDVGVWDPLLGEFVLVFDAPYGAEEGAFTVLDAGQEFHLVVQAFDASSSYDLEIRCTPATMFAESSDAGTGAAPRAAIREIPGSPGIQGQPGERATKGSEAGAAHELEDYAPAREADDSIVDRGLWIVADDDGGFEVLPWIGTAGGDVVFFPTRRGF